MLAGFYGIVEGELVGVYRCPNGICCPAFSNSQEQRLCPIGGSSEEICAATRAGAWLGRSSMGCCCAATLTGVRWAGFMCGECQDGYSEALGTYLCRNCQDGANVGLVVAGFVALFVGVGIIVYRGRMQGGSRSFLKILILKNALHFYQVCIVCVCGRAFCMRSLTIAKPKPPPDGGPGGWPAGENAHSCRVDAGDRGCEPPVGELR